MHTYEEDIINMENDAVRLAEDRHLGCAFIARGYGSIRSGPYATLHLD